MFPNPATAEPAPEAGGGQDGHKRSRSAESGAATDSTLVAADEGAVDTGHRAQPRAPKRAASVADVRADAAKRGRITTETAPGAPAHDPTTTKDDAGSPTAAAPKNVSIDTATALAVADPNANACNEPNDALDDGDDGAAGPTSDEETAAIDSQPDAIVANVDSRVRPGCPDTPVVARLPVPRSHVVAGTAVPAVAVAARNEPTRAFSTGRDASNAAPAVPPAPTVPPSSATARRYLPMRLPQHPPEVIAALCLLSAAVSHGEPDPDPAVEKDIQAKFKSIKRTMNALFTGAAVPTNGHRSTSPGPPEEDDSKNVYEGAEREAELAALEKYKDQERDNGWWDEDAPVDPALLELLKPERRRHFF